jgi:hypothetical protein
LRVSDLRLGVRRGAVGAALEVIEHEQPDRGLPCWRLLSISPTSSDSVMLRRPEISFMPFQNASSRLTLVL